MKVINVAPNDGVLNFINMQKSIQKKNGEDRYKPNSRQLEKSQEKG